MGTWGAGPFENDTASDVVDTLSERSGRQRVAYLDTLLDAVLTGTAPFDADVAMEAVAAAGVVVASVVPDAGLLDEDELDDVAVAVDDARWAAARRVVAILQEQPNELADLWAEAGAGGEHAATLRALADALAGARPRVKRRKRLRRAVRGLRHRPDEDQGVEEAQRPDAVYVAAGPRGTAFALAVLRDEWTSYTLIALAPDALPDPSTLTMASGPAGTTSATPFEVDDLPVYDGTPESVHAALFRPLDVTPELAEWIEQTVEMSEAMDEAPVRWS